MRRLISAQAIVLIVFLAAGCGSAGSDQQGEDGLTMAFLGFTGGDIEQADFVTDGAAQVDICQDLCSGGQGGELQFEPFTSTFVTAVFVNRGKADIILDSYSVDVPSSGVPPFTRRIGRRLTGGRCLGTDPQRACADDLDCLGGLCVHSESTVTLLLYDFDFKQRVRRGECPFDLESLTLNADLVFSGSDETGERFTIRTSYVSTFDNFDNCEDQ
jgi:hypothetical protein